MFIFGFQNLSFSFPWHDKKDSGFFSVGFSTEHYQHESERVKDIEYSKISYDAYLEYSLTDNYALGLQTMYSKYTNTLPYLEESVILMDKFEFFITQKLKETKTSVMSIKYAINVPFLYDSNVKIISLDQQIYYQATLGYGTDIKFKFAKKNWHAFTSFELGFRKRNDSNFDEIYAAGTLGIHITPKMTYLLQYFGTSTLENNYSSSQQQYLLLSSHKLRNSLVFNLEPSLYLQIGYYRQVGDGVDNLSTGLLASIWYKF